MKLYENDMEIIIKEKYNKGNIYKSNIELFGKLF